MSKPAKPFTFDGTNNSLTTITTWVFDVQQYLMLTDTPVEKESRLAASYLGGTAKTWYIDAFEKVTPPPSLEKFLTKFQSFFMNSSAVDDTFTQVVHIEQGRRTRNEYVTEFKLILGQLGPTTDACWSKRNFLCGLPRKV